MAPRRHAEEFSGWWHAHGMGMMKFEPPYLDEHETVVAATADEVWPALLETLELTFSRHRATLYARIVGCADSTPSGPRPLAEGATIPGFRVTAAIPRRELVLEGRHRFSWYALHFRLEQLDSGGTRLRAETRAAFPGLAGRAYRGLVLATGAHVAGVRRMLSTVRSRSEQRSRA